METVIVFIFFSSKITEDCDCSHGIKRCLLLGRKAMINLDNVLKSKDISFLMKAHMVKLVFFSSHVWMWDLDHKEGWVLRKWCFQIVVLKKTLESPLDYKENKTVNPKKKKINPEYSLERLLLKLKLQHFGHLMWRANSLEKTLMLEKIEGKGEGGGRDKMTSITNWMDLNLSKFGR